jgi:hypothetical protein
MQRYLVIVMMAEIDAGSMVSLNIEVGHNYGKASWQI